jgi:hypothetical protein
LPTCEQRVTYLVICISDLELESTFLEQSEAEEEVAALVVSTIAGADSTDALIINPGIEW